MSPTVVLKEDGSPFIVLGTPGATRIITTVTQLISNVIDHGMTIQEAIDAPRIFNTSTSAVAYEGRIDKSVIAELVEMGYEMDEKEEIDKYFGNAMRYITVMTENCMEVPTSAVTVSRSDIKRKIIIYQGDKRGLREKN